MEEVAKRAKEATVPLRHLDNTEKNEILSSFRGAFLKRREEILAANARDITNAKNSSSISESLLKRLDMSGSKFDDCLSGLQRVIDMKDPVGTCNLHTLVVEDELDLYRVSCPIGVIAVIYEARPEAGIQIASLAIKSGNALILKGGKEARETNLAIYEALREGLEANPKLVKPEAVQLVDTREEVSELLKLHDLINLVIPRGSKELVNYVMRNTEIPVLGHADGLCTVFVDQHADIPKAVSIVVDSKLNYPAACNAMETLLVHEKVAEEFLPLVAARLMEKCPTAQFKACPRSLPLLSASAATAVSEEDYHTEFLCGTCAVKVVSSIDEAVAHIEKYSSHHTDCIVSEDPDTVEFFMRKVDSAGVFANCSTRFADGYRYGFGAEVGISTSKIHARGPVGLEGLVTHKYRLYGKGNVVETFKNGNAKSVVPIMSVENIADIYKRHK